jgi:transketolase
MLLYSLLHLAGVAKTDDDGNPTSEPSVSIEDIKNFRQLHSPCAGHPEYGYAAGIETTTGPLGQGLGNSVGMAISAKYLAATYDRPNYELFGFNTYALCSDGDIMEGVACEAASLAGHLKLSNLCWIYDDNEITIEGRTDLAFSEDVATRFEGLGWQVITVTDANDLKSLDAAYKRFTEETDRPTLIVVKRRHLGCPRFSVRRRRNQAGQRSLWLDGGEVRRTERSNGSLPRRFGRTRQVFL